MLPARYRRDDPTVMRMPESPEIQEIPLEPMGGPNRQQVRFAEVQNGTKREEGVPNLSNGEFRCIKYITNCNGGHAFLGFMDTPSHQEYVVIKQYSPDKLTEYAKIAKEVANLRTLNHPFIVQLKRSFVYDLSVYVVTEAFQYGSLRDILTIHRKYGITEKAAIKLFDPIVQALEYLHAHRFIHRNIRPQHILIGAHGIVKLSGFRHLIDISFQQNNCHDFDTHLESQLYYCSPEMLTQNMSGYGRSSDIYTLGMVMCEALNGVVPFVEAEPLEMMYRKMNGQVPRPVDSTSLQDDKDLGFDISDRPAEHLSRTFSRELHDFVAKCVAYNPESRPTASQLRMHELFARWDPHTTLIDHLQLNPNDFCFEAWTQDPMMTPESYQYDDVSFDYSTLQGA